MQHISEFIQYMQSIKFRLGDVPVTYDVEVLPDEVRKFDITVYSEPVKHKRSKWIAVDDELPDNGREVLTWWPKVDLMREATWFNGKWNVASFSKVDMNGDDITHWRELPRFDPDAPAKRKLPRLEKLIGRLEWINGEIYNEITLMSDGSGCIHDTHGRRIETFRTLRDLRKYLAALPDPNEKSGKDDE